jgi:two-component system sensor histidine kinase PrrB
VSLRLRVVLAGLATVGVVLLATGWWLSASLERDGREEVDRQLDERAREVSPPAVAVEFGTAVAAAGKPARITAAKAKEKAKVVEQSTSLAPQPGAKLLDGAGVFTIVSPPEGEGKVAGDVPPGATGLGSTRGYVTRRLGGQTWRVLVTSMADGTVAMLGQSLEPVLARVSTTRGLLLRLGLVALAATGLAGLATGSVALRPLQRLRRRAEAIGFGDDAGAGLSAGGPPEVAALGGALNGMLVRLRDSGAETERALESTRRFAGDAGHELRTPLAGMSADIGVLQDRTGAMEPDAREAVASLAAQHRRLASLLDALQTLALGDARSALEFATVDLADVAEQSVASARRRHPGREVALDVALQRAPVHGWADGLRAIADNLVENALRHGGQRAAVLLTVRSSGDEVELCVDDGGPGVPAGERELVFERFGRGRGAAPGGSGLGLSIVAQQAALHGGCVAVGDSPSGGARFVVSLPLLAGSDTREPVSALQGVT